MPRKKSYNLSGGGGDNDPIAMPRPSESDESGGIVNYGANLNESTDSQPVESPPLDNVRMEAPDGNIDQEAADVEENGSPDTSLERNSESPTTNPDSGISDDESKKHKVDDTAITMGNDGTDIAMTDHVVMVADSTGTVPVLETQLSTDTLDSSFFDKENDNGELTL